MKHNIQPSYKGSFSIFFLKNFSMYLFYGDFKDLTKGLKY